MIITLCGSSRFEPWWHLWNEALGLSGHSCFALCAWPSMKSEREWYSTEQKKALDVVHFNKIEASEAIFVINKFAYIGESTAREIVHARSLRKKVISMESWGVGSGIGKNHSDTVRQSAESYGVPVEYRSPIDMIHHAQCFSPWDFLPEAGDYRNGIVKMIHDREEIAMIIKSRTA